jgi:hypothetical protein
MIEAACTGTVLINMKLFFYVIGGKVLIEFKPLDQKMVLPLPMRLLLHVRLADQEISKFLS